MKKLLTTALFAAILPVSGQAAIITIDAELLKNALGGAMPTTGLVVLTAGPTGTFGGPTALSFTSGDEVVLQRWDLAAFGMAGILSDRTSDFAFSGSLGEGDPVRIYWYPTLNLASAEPGAGTSYGTYRDAVGLDGSSAWVLGGEGDLTSLKMYTSDSTFLRAGGSNPGSAGNANLQVIPEPGTISLSLAALAVAGLIRRRKEPTGA